MSNYSKTTDFAAKDSLPSGDSGKIIRGSEFETEFDNISTAIATKADAADPTFTGTVTIDGLTVNGNTTLGNAATDTVTVTADIASNLIPSADDTYDLGAVGAEWNDLFIDGTANIDSLVADTADINGGTIDGVTIGGSSAGAITGTTITGTSFVTSGDMTFGDNDKIRLGAGNDLQIYHDGNNSIIEDTSTGNLQLITNGNAIALKSSDGDAMVSAIKDGDVKLYHNNNLKLATTSSGVDVTGSISADGLTVDGSDSNIKYNVASSDPHANPTFELKNQNATDGNVAVLKLSADNTNGVSGSAYVYAQSETTNQKGNLVFAREDGANTPVTSMKLSSNGDISFYEDTGTTAKLFWDASAESLGIGTTSPEQALHVKNASDTPAIFESTDFNSRLELRDNSGSSFVENRGGILNLKADTSNAVANSRIEFSVDNSEKMRLDSSGNLLVGKTAINTSTTGVQIENAGTITVTREGRALTLNRTTSDGELIQLRKDNTTVGSIGNTGADMFIGTTDVGIRFNDGNDAIQPYNTASGNRDAAIDLGSSSNRFKDLYLSGGVVFGTTGGNVTSATLDDYEEGTWTPQIGDSTGNTGTTSTADGHYTKVGRLVTVVVDIINIDTTALVSSEQVRIKNLPFTAFTVGNQPIFTAITQLGGIGASGKTIIASIQDQFGYIRLKESDSGLSSYLLVSDVTSPSADIRFSLTYFTA